MSGTKAGTGQRLNARCAKCARRVHSRFDRERRLGYNLMVRQIRKLAVRSHGSARYDSLHTYKYECVDCGHIGWSRHKDLSRQPVEARRK